MEKKSSEILHLLQRETFRFFKRVIQLERKNWIKYNAKTGVIYSPNEKNNKLIVEIIHEKEKDLQVIYLNSFEKSKSLPLQ